MAVLSNIVKQERLRKIQLETLETLAEALLLTFGPNGSNTQLYKGSEAPSKFSKDGHTVLKNIKLLHPIECSVRTSVEEITSHIANTVGDGTTSAVELSYQIFKCLLNIEEESKISPYELISKFNEITTKIIENIKSKAKPITLDAIYNICMIATNGNVELSQNIKDIYEKNGNNVFIDLTTSTDENTYVKSYDGLTLDAGYGDSSFITDTKKNICHIPSPRIYAFIDPVDTPEMIGLFDKILLDNIVAPIQSYQSAKSQDEVKDLIPTVILCPKLSRDMTSYVDSIITLCTQYTKANKSNQKPPFVFITNFSPDDQYMDLIKLCGCKPIKKYINLQTQQVDIEKGLAPTVDTVSENFYGGADFVECDSITTKFVNPQDMFVKVVNEDGTVSLEYSDTYNALVELVQAYINNTHKDGNNMYETYMLKKRLNSLSANVVEYMVGGISIAERDAKKDLLEDAIKSCRSAAKNGYGWGANFEAVNAIREIEAEIDKSLTQAELNDRSKWSVEKKIIWWIKGAYEDLIYILYKTCMSEDEADKERVKSLSLSKPINLRTKEYDDKVLASIETDIAIIEAIAKIITLLFTTNQFLCEGPVHPYVGKYDN